MQDMVFYVHKQPVPLYLSCCLSRHGPPITLSIYILFIRRNPSALVQLLSCSSFGPAPSMGMMKSGVLHVSKNTAPPGVRKRMSEGSRGGGRGGKGGNSRGSGGRGRGRG